MPRLAKAKKRKKLVVMVMVFEAFLSVGVGESTSLNMQRKSPRTARMKSKVAGSKKKTSKAATSTSEEPPSPEAGGRKCPPEQLVALEKQKGKVTTLWQRGKPKRVVVSDVPKGKLLAHHLTRMAYPFVSSATRNAFILCLLHAIYAVIEICMYHLTTLVNMLYSLLKLSIEDILVQ